VTDGLITSYATMIEQVTVPREAPDLDGLACAVAFAELLRALGFAARSFIGGRPDPEALFVAEALDVAMSGAAPQPGEPIVLVDASDIPKNPRGSSGCSAPLLGAGASGRVAGAGSGKTFRNPPPDRRAPTPAPPADE